MTDITQKNYIDSSLITNTTTSDITQKNYIDSMITNIPPISAFNEKYLVGNDLSFKKQEFIHPLGNLEYKIQTVNVVRDHDLWKFLFSLDMEMRSFSENDPSLMMAVYGEDPGR